MRDFFNRIGDDFANNLRLSKYNCNSRICIGAYKYKKQLILLLCIILVSAVCVYIHLKDRYELTDGAIYIGEWNDSLQCPNGEGIVIVKNKERDNDTIKGIWENGNMVEIISKSEGFSKFEGLISLASYSSNENNFQARTYSSGERYLGFFKDGMRHGDLGLCIKPDGKMLFGKWTNGQLQKHRPEFTIEDHVYGIDISHYQGGQLDWDHFCFRANKSGIVTGKKDIPDYEVLPVLFVMVKATEGDIQDSYFKGFYKEASRHRIIRGAYHILTLGSSVDVQVDNYLKTVGTFYTADLPPILDVEDMNNGNNLQMIAAALDWMELVEKKTGRCPMLYIREKLYKKYILSSPSLKRVFAKYPLWIARYNDSGPSGEINWTFWQKTDHGFVNGIKEENRYVDISCFNGSYKDLEQFVRDYGFSKCWKYRKK